MRAAASEAFPRWILARKQRPGIFGSSPRIDLTLQHQIDFRIAWK
jgi:hypothetical protein